MRGYVEAEMRTELVEHDANWTQAFERERRRLQTVLAESYPEIHHIGSTAIPGIKAKPVIDIIIWLPPPLEQSDRACQELCVNAIRPVPGLRI